MPNGGMLPCCHVCQWKTALAKIGQVYCQKNQLTIRHSHHTFCSLLSNTQSPGLADFVASEHIEPDAIYAWIEISTPGLALYYHEYAILTSVKAYATWTEDHDTSTRRVLDAQLLERLKSQGKPNE